MNNTEKNNVGDPPSDLSNRSPNPSTSMETTTPYPEVMKNYSNLCRICGIVTEFEVPIFSGEGLQLDFMEKIHKYLPIKVTEQDVLPRHLCHQCANTLLAWDELYSCCQKADAAFHQQLEIAKSTVSPTNQNTSQDTEDKKKYLRGSYDSFGVCDITGFRQNISNETLISDESDEYVDEDNDPLSKLATTKTSEQYQNFYEKFKKFKDHFFKKHLSCETDVTSDSSESEDEQNALDDENNHVYDDLCNMRKDRMDDETRLELSEVRTKVNGKVFFTCKICGKNLSSTHTYVHHKRIHTGERPCVCHICGKQFRAPNGLQRHLTETHEKQRRYSCLMCEKQFVNSQNLKLHMRIHTGERPFGCPHCGKRFTQSGSLHVHLKIHNELYPYSCAECGAKFKLGSGLTRHKLKHTGERPHACKTCGKTFRQKHELNSHILIHTDAKPFGCTMCGASFRQRRALRYHRKRLHDSESKEVTFNLY